MNERIEKLADEAEEYAVRVTTGDWEVGLAYQDMFNKKFAELIVAECISVVATLSPDYPLRYKNNLLIEIHHRDQIEEVFRGDCVEEIKQHFGVEECAK